MDALPALLLPWYNAYARDLPWRQDREPYHVWLSEIMLQQTRVEAVRQYYIRFLQALPDIPALAEAEEGFLLKLWEGLGYYSRARNLQKAAKQIMQEYGGVFPSEYDKIRALPGIGAYTAGAIASICFEMPTPAVDGNVLRVYARLREIAEPVDLPQTKMRMERELAALYPAGACGAFTQALMELGAVICVPKKPKCVQCPVASVCMAAAHNTAEQFPLRLPKRGRRLEERTVFLFDCGGAYAIERRKSSGLLAGLWQLPNVHGTLTPADAVNTALEDGLCPIELIRETHRTHIFTHIRWDMVCYHIRCSEKTGKYTWATKKELTGKYALPTAFRMFLEAQEF